MDNLQEPFFFDEAETGGERDMRKRFRHFRKSLWNGCCKSCRRVTPKLPREIEIGKPSRVQTYAPNVVRNQKYNLFTFLPLVLFHQFSMFLDMCFLIMAISQFFPSLRVGYLYTYWGPLAFVVIINMLREAVDDIRRWKRDREVNSTKYTKLMPGGHEIISSSKIEVGDLIVAEKNQRIPADLLLLRTTEKNGACFIRTDQLDGETDWKLKLAVPSFQALENDHEIFNIQGRVVAEPPRKEIHSFEGTFHLSGNMVEPLTHDNMLWSTTVLANGSAVGLVVYTGKETRSVMNINPPRTKLGAIDLEINNFMKLLVVTVFVLSFIMVALKGFNGLWYKYLWRFFLLFSYIVPLALRVNLDGAKAVTSFIIMRDPNIPENIVRSTTIPEELGRISYLLSDKTGTLTKNEMIFKKLHLGTVSYGTDSMQEVASSIAAHFAGRCSKTEGNGKIRRTPEMRIFDAVKAIAICHNVTPVTETVVVNGERNDAMTPLNDTEETTASSTELVTYQASSPDEVALVSWTENVGLTLVHRDLSSLTLSSAAGELFHFDILQVFPFTSDTKRMGIIVRDRQTNEIVFYQKGADVVMSKIVIYADWLEEETGNMAREGLRTLVFGRKVLTEEQYLDFSNRYHQAKTSMQDRQAKVASAIATLERDLDLLGLSGVEDQLQDMVRPILETLRNAGIRIWMLTGDKLETAQCIAKSSRLVSRDQIMHTFPDVSNRTEAHTQLNAFRRHADAVLVISGNSLEVCLQYYEYEFVELACQSPSVIVCRCAPTQKAVIVELLKHHTHKRCAAIGDGGNDVSMIQAADVGIGLQGKEGRQASLAADFSLVQFSHIAPLLLVHGRNCYKNTATLSQFIIHRGIIISVMQVVFSAVFYFVAIPLYPGILMVGYATLFTMFPVFSLVLDKDVSDSVALRFPELYKELMRGRELSFKTFFVWVLISIYQGGIIMYGALLLFEDDFIHVVSITFTALIITELLMVSLTIRTWHILMVVAEFVSVLIYFLALICLKNYFDQAFLRTPAFLWRTAAISAVSCVPLFLLKFIRFKLRPPIYSKLQE